MQIKGLWNLGTCPKDLSLSMHYGYFTASWLVKGRSGSSGTSEILDFKGKFLYFPEIVLLWSIGIFA